MTIPSTTTPDYGLHPGEWEPSPAIPKNYNRYYFNPTQMPAERIVGMLACQRDPYLRSLKSIITASRKATPPAPIAAAKQPKKDKKAGKGQASGSTTPQVVSGSATPEVKEPEGELYEVEFVDTVLFPEGGGQPNDTGYLRIIDTSAGSAPISLRVENVQRLGLTAVHHVRIPSELVSSVDSLLKVGNDVEMHVDWERRVDHMTCHTAQHLVSALFDNEFGLATLSWALPPFPSLEPSYIELPRSITESERLFIEGKANELVMNRGQRSIEEGEGTRVWIESRVQGQKSGLSGTSTPLKVEDESEKEGLGLGEDEKEYGDRGSRGLPKDYSGGVIRTAVIDGVDRSLCCGTHHPYVSRCQYVHILPPTTVSTKPTRVWVLAGPRALRSMLNTSTSLTKVSMTLGVNREMVEGTVSARMISGRDNERKNNVLRAELGVVLGKGVQWTETGDSRTALIRRDEESTHDFEFLGSISANASSSLPTPTTPYLLILYSTLLSPKTSTHTDASSTLVQITSYPPEKAKEVGEKLKAGMDALEGGEKGRVKGGGAKGRWQGKVSGKWRVDEDELMKTLIV